MTARRFLLLAGLATAAALAGRPARADEPTTAECLAASDASNELDAQHKVLEERARLLVCAADSCPADIRKECLTRVGAVNVQIPTIVFSAKDGKGADRTAVRVTMDGAILAERLEGTSLAVDPGEHSFVFETEGEAPVRDTLLIVEGQKDRRESIAFGPPPAPVAPPRPPLPPPAPVERRDLGTQKVLALAAAGVGVAGIGIGIAYGLSAIAKRSDAQTMCPNECSSTAGANAWSNAVSTGNASTVAFVAGGLGLAAGAALWLTAPSANPSTPGVQVALGAGTLRLDGRW